MTHIERNKAIHRLNVEWGNLVEAQNKYHPSYTTLALLSGFVMNYPHVWAVRIFEIFPKLVKNVLEIDGFIPLQEGFYFGYRPLQPKRQTTSASRNTTAPPESDVEAAKRSREQSGTSVGAKETTSAQTAADEEEKSSDSTGHRRQTSRSPTRTGTANAAKPDTPPQRMPLEQDLLEANLVGSSFGDTLEKARAAYAALAMASADVGLDGAGPDTYCASK